MAWPTLGGSGAHTSSQISTAILKQSALGWQNKSFVPKGTVWPSTSIVKIPTGAAVKRRPS